MALLDLLQQMKIQAREKRAQAEADFARRQEAQTGQENLRSYRGILADPSIGVAGAGNLAQLLGSASPEARQMGQSLIARHLAARAPLTAQEQADTRRSEALAGIAEAQLGFEPTRQGIEQAKGLAYINRMDAQRAKAASDTSLAMLRMGLENEDGLRKEFNADPIVNKTAQAIVSLDQMDRALALNNFQALQAAIVAIVQVQEPGLAVRNDDRIAYQGNNSLASQIVASFNKMVSGEDVPPEVPARMRALALQLAAPLAASYSRIEGEYRDIAAATPGARPQAVTIGSGVDPQWLQLLRQVYERGQRGQ